MRRHAKATSSRSSERKPSGFGSSSSSGRIRLTVLIATVAAFLLVPAAQAFANGTLKVNIAGNGSGELNSSENGGGQLEGIPPIECSYEGATETTSGICEDELSREFEFEGTVVAAKAAPGSQLIGWEVNKEGVFNFGCNGSEESCGPVGFEGSESEFEITAYFEKEAPTGPTNRALLTITKSGTPNSAGTVKSKPKGINCASACTKAEASLYKETKVAITAKAATGSTFVEWTGACSGSGACEVTMNEAKEVNAVFGGTSKEIVNAKTLSLSKEGSGFGTVKATGLACEPDCTGTEVSYFGGTEGPKAKPAAKAVLTAVASAGSEFNGWSGACSGTGPCEVTMSEAASVGAEFTALPKNTLTLTKSGPPNSAGTVKAKGSVNCGSACSEATASLSADAVVTLSAKAATGSTFTGWSGGGCSGTGSCVVSMSSAKEVTAEFGGASKEIVNPQTLSLAKAGSGYGTVKATGIACEVLCTSTKASYFGGLGGPKPKAATTVTLVATSAPGSKAVVWSGCDSEPEGKCVVAMSEAKSVTATFDELE